MDSPTSSWLTPLQALEKVEAQLTSALEAKPILVGWIRDGRVTMTAENAHPSVLQSPPPGSAEWLKLSPTRFGDAGAVIVSVPLRATSRAEKATRRYVIEPAFWNAPNEDPGGEDRWDWQSGTVRASRRGRTVTLQNLLLAGDAIDRLLLVKDQRSERLPAPTAPPKQKGPGGAPRQSDWDGWVAELAALIADGEYRLSWSAGDLHDQITDRLHARGNDVPSFDKVDSAARAVKRRLRDRSLGGSS